MDAATLYMVLTLPNGVQTTAIKKFPTLEACEAQVEWLRRLDPIDRHPLYRCEGHNPFAFLAHYRRGRSRRLIGFSSRQACGAYKWVAYLRDRGVRKLGYCSEYPPPPHHGWVE
jgi:hypothetical protein